MQRAQPATTVREITSQARPHRSDVDKR